MSGRCGDADAAAIAGYGLDSFRRVWPQLVAQGMPAPTYNLKRNGQPSKWRSWDKVALERWQEGKRDPRFRAVATSSGLVAERHRLDRRLAGAGQHDH